MIFDWENIEVQICIIHIKFFVQNLLVVRNDSHCLLFELLILRVTKYFTTWRNKVVISLKQYSCWLWLFLKIFFSQIQNLFGLAFECIQKLILNSVVVKAILWLLILFFVWWSWINKIWLWIRRKRRKRWIRRLKRFFFLNWFWSRIQIYLSLISWLI